jgi:Fe-S cluster biogenesis protein NfuA
VKIELQGSCSGWPSSIMTLKQGVQNLLCHYVREVKKVEATQDSI